MHNTKMSKDFQTSQASTFRILQHLATNGNFTNYKMLFLAVVKDFPFFAEMEIQFKRGMVHLGDSFLDGFYKSLSKFFVLKHFGLDGSHKETSASFCPIFTYRKVYFKIQII